MVEPQRKISIQAEIDAEKKLSIKMIVAYLDERFPDFPKFFRDRFSNTYLNASEPIISQWLCSFLNNFRNQEEASLFEFGREFKSSRYAVDFAVIDVKSFKESIEESKPFFTIEAKRLPAPKKNKKDDSREKEYVEGNGGGVERYKRGKHGKDLFQSAIIGYIQKESCSYWVTEINKWIKNLEPKSDSSIQWSSDDLLVQSNDFGKTKKYHSKNTRIIDSEEDSIELYHYLIELN
jgi:hypothetical protein